MKKTALKVELVRSGCSDNPIKAIAQASAECHNINPGEDIDTYVKRVLDMGHLAMAEFANFQFRVTGVSRALTHQLVRKRLASYAQRSQRRVDEEGFMVIIPATVKPEDEAEFLADMDIVDGLYCKWKERIPKEDARFFLPNGCETRIHILMNGHGLIDFSGERLCGKAQWEIRAMVTEMKRVLEEFCPLIASYMQPKCIQHGRCKEGKKSCGIIRQFVDSEIHRRLNAEGL